MGIIVAQFVTEKYDPESALIRWASNGEYSHVDIVLPEGTLLGARANGGVKIRNFNYAKFTAKSVVQVYVPDYDAAMNFAMSQIGKPYNYGAIADMIFGRDRGYDSENQPSWFCDELLYATVSAGGRWLLNEPNPLVLTPQEVYLSPFWRFA